LKNILSKIAEKVANVVPEKLFNLSKEDEKLLDELGAGRKVTKELAIAVLVSEIALCDLTFDKREYDYLFSYFKDRFALKDGEIRNLIQHGTQVMASLQTTEQFAQHLTETADETERKDLLAMVKGLISVDHLEHGFELYLFERLERLLGFKNSSENSSDH